MTSLTPHHKITPAHLSRKAVVYLRQSSARQVQENLESQRLQYALADRARELGWQRVEIVDTEENIEKLLPWLDDVEREGLVTLEEIKIVNYRSSRLPN